MSQIETAGILTELESDGYRPDGSWAECDDRNKVILHYAHEENATKMEERYKTNPNLEAAFRLATQIGADLMGVQVIELVRFDADPDEEDEDFEVVSDGFSTEEEISFAS